MKLNDFKYRIYDTKEKRYLRDDELTQALLSNDDRYEVELISNLKTTHGDTYFYDKDIAQIDLYNGSKITTLYACVKYTNEREWYMKFYSNETNIISPLETFNINKDFIKEYDKIELRMYGNLHDEDIENKIRHEKLIDFNKLNRMLLSLF